MTLILFAGLIGVIIIMILKRPIAHKSQAIGLKLGLLGSSFYKDVIR